MRIHDLSVDGFGIWHELDLPRISPTVTLFYGPNEAGKTTLMQFLRSILYGVSAERRQAYLPPLRGGRPGGKLGVETDDGRLQISRYADRDADDIGRVTVQLPDGRQQGDRLLREAIDPVDEATFNNVFAIGLDEIQHLGTLGGSQAAQWIYRLTSGLDRVSLYDVIQGLRASRQRLLGGEPGTSDVARLRAERDRLAGEVAHLAGQTRAWCQRAVEIAEIEGQITAAREQLRERQQAARRAEVAVGIRPQWQKRSQIDTQIAAFADLHPLEPGAIAKLDDLKDQIEEHQRQRDILKGQRRQLRQEADELGINEPLVQNTRRIEALAEQQEWLESLAEQSAEFQAEADQLAEQFESETGRLAQQWFGDAERRLVLSADQLEQLAPQREALEAARKELDETQAELETHRDHEEKYRAQLASAATSSEQLGLPSNLQEAGEQVARLRRRLNVEQRIEQIRRSGVELEQQARAMLDGQVIPLRLYVAWGGCVFGAAALLFSWLVTEGRPELGQAGAVLAVISVLIPFFRWASESRLADELDGVHRQIDDLNRQLEEAKTEKQQLDEELPVADGSIVLRLQTAEKHLAELEDMLPVESERRRASEASRAAQAAYQAAKSRFEAAERAWRGALKALGLPEQLAPKELDLLAGQYQQLAQLEAKAQSRVEDMQRRQREFQRVTTRIERLAQETNLVLADAEPLAQLEHLLSESRLQTSKLERRKKLRERAANLKAEEAKHASAATALERQRDAMFEAAGVDHETAFRQLAADLAEAARLRDERTALTREIAAALGSLGDEEDFAPLLAADVADALEQQWEKLADEQQATETQLDALVTERATLVERQRSLADDTSLTEKQMELSVVEAKLERAQTAWRDRAVVSQTLEHVRHDYEQHRQPETLVEATGYFRELTGGHYTRVWTPLANDVLYVDRADGQSLAVESLSRGTREQLFLSVRLAVVAMFARRGVKLPMILDDVLVNYDEQRATVAAKVLCQFAAEGHQLLVFTCHEHIFQIFQKLSADCRRLPIRGGTEEVVETPQPELQVVDSAVEPVAAVAADDEPPPDNTEPTVAESPAELQEESIDYLYPAPLKARQPAPPVDYDYGVSPIAPSQQAAEEVEYAWDHDDPEWATLADDGQRPDATEPLVYTRLG